LAAVLLFDLWMPQQLVHARGVQAVALPPQQVERAAPAQALVLPVPVLWWWLQEVVSAVQAALVAQLSAAVVAAEGHAWERGLWRGAGLLFGPCWGQH